MTETDDLPQLFDDPRNEYDVAADIVDAALAEATLDDGPGAAEGLVLYVIPDMDEDVTERARDLAIGAVETAIRDAVECPYGNDGCYPRHHGYYDEDSEYAGYYHCGQCWRDRQQG